MGLFLRAFNGLYNAVTDDGISGWWQEKYFGSGMAPTNCSFKTIFFFGKTIKIRHLNSQRYVYFTVNERESNYFWKWLFCFKNLNLNVYISREMKKSYVLWTSVLFYCIFFLIVLCLFQNKTFIPLWNLPFPFSGLYYSTGYSISWL